MATKWGVLSAGKICHDFVTAVRSSSADNHKVWNFLIKYLVIRHRLVLNLKLCCCFDNIIIGSDNIEQIIHALQSFRTNACVLVVICA